MRLKLGLKGPSIIVKNINYDFKIIFLISYKNKIRISVKLITRANKINWGVILLASFWSFDKAPLPKKKPLIIH